MSILDDLASPPPRASGFRGWLADQPANVKAALEAAAKDSRWSSHALAQTIRRNGGICSKESIAAWRTELGFKG